MYDHDKQLQFFHRFISRENQLIIILNPQFLQMENRLKSSEYRLTNSFYPSKSGLITTVAQGSEEEDIRKSRIEHLPSYKKVDLSGKLQFVVVFQTMQIERLSLEIQSLRVKLKDADRQIRNYLNYEVQIKELTQNCHMLEEQRINYQNQVEQMSLGCNSLFQELNDCKKQYERDLDSIKKEFLKNKQEWSRENDALKDIIKKLQNELEKKAENQKQAQNKVKTISQELVRLNQNLYQSQNEIAQLREKEAKKGDEINRIQQDMKALQNAAKQQKSQVQAKKNKLEAQKNEKERMINNLADEKRKLTNDIDKKKEEIQALNKKSDKEAKILESCMKEIQGVKKQNEAIKGEYSNLQKQYNHAVNQLNQLEEAHNELQNQLSNIVNDMKKEKQLSKQLGGFANELKNKIQEKSKELVGFKKYLTDYDRELQNKAKRQNELIQKLAQLDSVIAQNGSLQEKIYELNNKLNQKSEQLNGKDQYITDLTIQNKELFHHAKQLEGNCQRGEVMLNQLEQKLEKQRQDAQSEKKKLVSEYQKTLERQNDEKKAIKGQKEQLERQIEKIKSDGLIKEEMKNEVRRLTDNCKRQEKDIQTMTGRFQGIQTLMRNLKEKCSQFNQIEKTNNILKQQLDSSFGLNDKMIQKIGSLEQEIENLTDQNWKLMDKLRQDSFKDDFSTTSSNKTIESLVLGKNTPLSGSMRFSSVQPASQFESPQERFERPSALSNGAGQGFSSNPISNFGAGFNSNFNSYGIGNTGFSTDRQTFNADVNISRTREGLDSKRVLEPSSYYPSRESNYSSTGVYSSMIGQYSSRDSGYGLQRRERR